VLLLDCEDEASALRSLSAAIGATESAVRHALNVYGELSGNEPPHSMPDDVLSGFGTERERVAERFVGACYFHGTRTLDPGAFRRRGILPLSDMLDEVWDILHSLVAVEINQRDWMAFRMSIEQGAGGDSGWAYRVKTGDPRNHGPCGTLVREMVLAPPSFVHDYLDCPEIIQDIARSYEAAFGTDLERRFRAVSTPCIVKFRSKDVCSGTVESALWYAYAKLRGEKIGFEANAGTPGNGRRVPPGDVLDVVAAS
jgi:hypothetical protein